MKIDDSTEIIKIVLKNISNGNEEILFEREGSKCFFAKEKSFDNYIIRLRLDWGDIKNGEPTLDVDISTKETGKKKKNGPWHHNVKKYDKKLGQMIYTFNFENLELSLSSTKTFSKNIPTKAQATPLINIKVIRANGFKI